MLKKNIQSRRLEDRISSAESVVAPGTKFKGDLDGPDSVRIFGQFEGEINSTHLVRVGKGAVISGTIKSPYVIIEGELIGDVKSAEKVELGEESRVRGNIETLRLAVADGSFFEGKIKMPMDAEKPIKFVEKRKTEEQSESEK